MKPSSPNLLPIQQKLQALLVHLDFGTTENSDEVQEFQQLAKSAGIFPVAVMTAARHSPDARYFVGSGKAQEIYQQILLHKVPWVLFNHDLSPSQQRNLEKLWQVRVLDRSSLILEIFAQRARTFEGKLQVELAQLQHLSTRLIRGWTHLERQKGGIGLRGGPGETQLETDRRLIRQKITAIKTRLTKVRASRAQNRRARQRAEIPTLALVGYTNAGKSTLFNKITQNQVVAKDLLFSTLDPTLRQSTLPEIGKVVFVDTVGFIRKLPHSLIEAFKATLEETCQADLLLHVLDAAHAEQALQQATVNEVLAEIGAREVPYLLVYNKIDKLPDFTPRIDRDVTGRPWRVWVSAESGVGIELLQQALIELLGAEMISCQLQLQAEEGRLRAQLYDLKVVLQEQQLAEGGWQLELKLSPLQYQKLLAMQVQIS